MTTPVADQFVTRASRPELSQGSGSVSVQDGGALLSRRHLTALDGIRGLAILMVLITHFFSGGGCEAAVNHSLPIVGPLITKLVLAGPAGVDLFFVLSGLLITGILLDSKATPRYFDNFYMRRFLRIFPLYYGVLTLIYGATR